jgi:hypothetical protein
VSVASAVVAVVVVAAAGCLVAIAGRSGRLAALRYGHKFVYVDVAAGDRWEAVSLAGEWVVV